MSAEPGLATRTGQESNRFGLVELDLLAAHAGARCPFPLRVPEFGRIAGEREVLLAAAGATLRARGLADVRGPLGVAAELVTALGEHRGAVDLVLAGPDSVIGVAAMVYGDRALICGQPLTETPTAGVWVRRVLRNVLADELMAMVPQVAPAQVMPITFRPDDADRVDSAVLDGLVSVLGELTGSGQLGASSHGTGETRSETELSWLDGPRGRVRVSSAPGGWVSVNPLRRNDLRLVLDELVTIAGRESDGNWL